MTLEDWAYLKQEVPQLRDFEEYLHDYEFKHRLLIQIEKEPIHNRPELFMKLMHIVRDESYRLQMQEISLRKSCKAAHAVAEASKRHTLHLLVSGMDCEGFWTDWIKNVEEQEEYFERSGENVWLETIHLDKLRELIDEESDLLQPFSRIRIDATPITPIPTPPAMKTSPMIQTAPETKPSPPQNIVTVAERVHDAMEEEWRKFREVNAAHEYRCPGSLDTTACTPHQATMLRLIAQELREKRLPDERLRERFVNVLNE
jgi:hypothetical protein